jgi:hypothetical protein
MQIAKYLNSGVAASGLRLRPWKSALPGQG